MLRRTILLATGFVQRLLRSELSRLQKLVLAIVQFGTLILELALLHYQEHSSRRPTAMRHFPCLPALSSAYWVLRAASNGSFSVTEAGSPGLISFDRVELHRGTA